MSNAIKAALEAACQRFDIGERTNKENGRHEIVRTLYDSRGAITGHEVLASFPFSAPWQQVSAAADRLRMAAAIAAFLDARARHHRRTTGMQVYADFLEDEAAAVERAATEGER